MLRVVDEGVMGTADNEGGTQTIKQSVINSFSTSPVS